MGGFIGRTSVYNNAFVKNCSNSGYYIRGASHVGGFSALFRVGNNDKNESVASVAYDSAFPAVPEAFLGSKVYGVMAENCYSLDSEVFSVADGSAADSGAMFSCVGGVVIRNCYTNNVMYGDKQTGGFVGRVVAGPAASPAPGITGNYYDKANTASVNSYFENCYSSGVVEGNERIGGFVAYIAGSAFGDQTLGGNAIFKNCYTTAMVGIDYADTDLGGFIGYDESFCTTTMNVEINGSVQAVNGSAYINCYAAGEVGNILTDTTVVSVAQNDSTPRLGGFIGSGYALRGYYAGCYYDMQTTAMRERVSGDGTVRNGIDGVYTQGSSVKSMAGLTYSLSAPSVTMQDGSSVWSYAEGYYPRLAVFEAEGTGSVFYVPTETGDKVSYSVPIADWISTETDGTVAAETLDMVRTANNFSKASTATVFLEHWDSIVDTDTGTVPGENDWVCGVSENKMQWNETKGRWELSYENVKAGSYEFKIQQGTSWAYNFGSDGYNGGNCTLALDSDSDVIIGFSYENKLTEVGGSNVRYRIEAEITPVGSNKTTTVFLGTNELQGTTSYVVAGTKRLTGHNWDTSADDMKMAETAPGSGIYTLTIDNVEGGCNYAYTVVPEGGTRDTSVNHFFYLKSADEGGRTAYQVTITYNSNDGTASHKVFEANSGIDGNNLTSGDDVTAECLEPPRMAEQAGDVEKDLIEFYSVAGDKGLTGHNWLGVDSDTEEYREQAAAAGRMVYNENTQKYEKTWFNVVLGGSEVYSYSFKIVANGNWDCGIDYGVKGANYVLMLQNDETMQCNVTITFDPVTEEIQVRTDPADCIVEIAEDDFSWYVASDYLMVSNDAYTSTVTTYDTVRDITTSFGFTADRDLSWGVDEIRNAMEGYYGSFADGDSFTIPYEIGGKTTTGSFGGYVLTMEESEENGVTSYYVSDFMPGKNWVQVVSGNEGELETGFAGSRRIRLLPSAFVEAGTNADVSVVYDGETSAWGNEVHWAESTGSLTLSGVKNETFPYYNFALGIGYAVTDKIGKGVYDNYSRQELQGYEAGKLRDDGDSTKFTDGQYYAMYSTFAQTTDYNDNYSGGTPDGESVKLDTLVSQAMIGPSYDDGSGNKGKTIVKVYRKGADGSTDSKVVMDSTDRNSAYYRNYLKWTGQELFTQADAGEYRVTVYWLMSDGRYLTDSKYVRIYEGNTGNLEISKEVSGDGGELNRAFQFTLTLNDSSINGYYGNVAFSNGTTRFTLRHGESVQVMGLSAGISYTVEETVSEGYVTTVTDASGNTREGLSAVGTVRKDITDKMSYVNHRDAPAVEETPPDTEVPPPETETPPDMEKPEDTKKPGDSEETGSGADGSTTYLKSPKTYDSGVSGYFVAAVCCGIGLVVINRRKTLK